NESHSCVASRPPRQTLLPYTTLFRSEARTSHSSQYAFGNREIEAVADASRLLANAAGVSRHGVGRSVMVENGSSTFVNDALVTGDRKSTRLNSSHLVISYAVFCLKIQ